MHSINRQSCQLLQYTYPKLIQSHISSLSTPPLLPKPLRKPLQHGLCLLRRPRRHRLTAPLLNISVTAAYHTALLRPLPHRRSVRRHLHRLPALVGARFCCPRRRKIARWRILRWRIAAVVHGRWLGPAAVLPLLVGRAGWVEGEVGFGRLAVAFALLPGDEELDIYIRKEEGGGGKSSGKSSGKR